MEGDIIYVVRKPLGFKSFEVRKSVHSSKLDQLIARTMLYRHYGIEVEDGNVIHFICESIHLLDESSIKKTTMEDFIKDGVKMVDHDITYKFSREHVVKRAYSRLNTKFDGYSIYNNNCEHFAAWCANGNKVCKQVKFAKGGHTLVQSTKKVKDKLVSVMTLL